jgi:hypothetical protein
MRIRELLENKFFKDLDFVKSTETGRELDYDLVEDLTHFMNHDDDVYRRHVYPSIANCLDRANSKRSINPDIFKPAVVSSYKLYVKKFPIRELPESLDEKTVNSICKKMQEDFKQHLADGKYKD